MWEVKGKIRISRQLTPSIFPSFFLKVGCQPGPISYKEKKSKKNPTSISCCLFLFPLILLTAVKVEGYRSKFCEDKWDEMKQP